MVPLLALFCFSLKLPCYLCDWTWGSSGSISPSIDNTVKCRGKICVQMKLGLEDSWRWVITGSLLGFQHPLKQAPEASSTWSVSLWGRWGAKDFVFSQINKGSVNMVYLLSDKEVFSESFPPHTQDLKLSWTQTLGESNLPAWLSRLSIKESL